MRFENQVVMITGASVGIGRAAALKFAQEGASLVLADVDARGLEALRTELAALTSAAALTFVCDVSDRQAVESMAAEALLKLGKIDVLVNNAALWRCSSSFMDTPMEDWKKFLEVNVMGVVYCTHAVLGNMLERGHGSVINVASVAGVYGNANMVHYSATKGALLAFTKALAKETAHRGVRINSVSPGTVSPSSNHDPHFHQPSAMNYMGRTGTDMENADLIAFLASDEASYISGQNILIDGVRKNI